MNFLELCQRVASECGVSLTGPGDTTNQVGRLGQIVKWTRQADMDIQTLHDNWNFMRSSFTLAVTAGDGKYAYGDCLDVETGAAITHFRSWCDDTVMKIYKTASGIGTQTDLHFLCYPDWDSRYNLGNQTNSYPFFWSQHPDRSLLLAPKPDDAFVVSGDYMKSATELEGDSAEPLFPSEYHMAIVYRAMMKYGRYAGASEVYSDGQAEYRRVINEMKRNLRPADLTGEALA